jgi:hypothetical protein
MGALPLLKMLVYAEMGRRWASENIVDFFYKLNRYFILPK